MNTNLLELVELNIYGINESPVEYLTVFIDSKQNSSIRKALNSKLYAYCIQTSYRHESTGVITLVALHFLLFFLE